MSLKRKIYAVVFLLIILAVFIGGSGMYAMRQIDTGLVRAVKLSESVSDLKDLKSEMQDVLISVREIVLSPDAAAEAEEKAEIDKSVVSIDNYLKTIDVGPNSADLWVSLSNEWNKHKSIVARIYDASIAGDKDSAFAILMNECNPTRREESRLIGAVVANEESDSRAAAAQADVDYKRAW